MISTAPNTVPEPTIPQDPEEARLLNAVLAKKAEIQAKQAELNSAEDDLTEYRYAIFMRERAAMMASCMPCSFARPC